MKELYYWNMRILNCCTHDWANFSYENCKALKSVGADAHSVKMERHKLAYSGQSKVVDIRGLQQEIERGDTVQIMHSDLTCLAICKRLNKRVVVYHTGSGYRAAPQVMNNLFNPHVNFAVTDQTEFIGLGMKDEYYLTCPINTEKLKAAITPDRRQPLFAHYPSSTEVKGSADIIEALERAGVKYDFCHKRISHPRQIERMGKCQVYVELFKPFLNGKKYGCFGVTALEAAALGKVVITGHTTPKVYRKFYRTKTPFFTPNTKEQLLKVITKVAQMPPQELYMRRLETRAWVERYHSYEATGRLILWLLFERKVTGERSSARADEQLAALSS
jgi:glycosyltransferase involved in cell wall biosynthesis